MPSACNNCFLEPYNWFTKPSLRSGLVNQLWGSRKQLLQALGIITQQECLFCFINSFIQSSLLRSLLMAVGSFFLCSPDCPKQPRTSFPFYKLFHATISARISDWITLLTYDMDQALEKYCIHVLFLPYVLLSRGMRSVRSLKLCLSNV